MAWLIYGTPSDPRMDPQFGWTEESEAVVGRLYERSWEAVMLDDAPRLSLQKAAHSRRQSDPPDFFQPAGIWVVSEEFRSIVAELEPHQNQFLPVIMLDKAGHELPLKFYLMNITQMDDALTLEKSDVHASWLEGRTATGELKRVRTWHLDPRPQVLFADKARVGGKHLWRGKKFFRNRLFFSDDLMKSVKQRRLRGLVSYYITEE